MANSDFDLFNLGFTLTAQAGTVSANCNDIFFLNQGTTTVMINQVLTIAPGAAFDFPGNAKEINTTVYNINFTGAGVNSLIIIRKYFNDYKG